MSCDYLVSLEDAKKYLQMWRDAQQSVATGQSYKIGTRSLTRASMSEIMGQIRYWENYIDNLCSGRGRRRGVSVNRFIPRDL